MTVRRLFVALAVAAALLLSGWGVLAALSRDGGRDDGWETAAPGSVGLDPAPLAELADAAEAAASDCLVVVRNGRIVSEHYWRQRSRDEAREAWSITKSIAATLVGIAHEQGHLDIDDPVTDHVAAWRGTPKEAITVRHLLTQTSGLSTADEFGDLLLAADQRAYALDEVPLEAEPGTTWAYSNNGVQVLGAVLAEATGQSVADYADEHLFEPLGMDATLTRDEAGNTLTYSGVQATCRDLARFGLVHLRGGEWEGEAVVPSPWVEEMTQPATELNPAYGYLWWLNREGEIGGIAAGTERETPAPAASDDAYHAAGLGGQYVVVFPEWDAVVVRMSKGADKGALAFGPAEVASALAEATAAADGSGSD